MPPPPLPLLELDTLTIHTLIDNDLDPISTPSHPPTTLLTTGNLMHIAHSNPHPPSPLRGSNTTELRLSDVCTAAHGLSLLITGTIGMQSRTLLFDAGPEGDAFERNVARLRLRADLGHVETVVLSHWHRDHSGGLVSAVRMVGDARRERERSGSGGEEQIEEGKVTVDLHPDRPAYRGFMSPVGPVSLEADPGFEEIEAAGGTVVKSKTAHAVLGGYFVVSGEIPRVTGYERGVLRGLRWVEATGGAGDGEGEEGGKWVSDELIADERLLMCRVKGKGLVVFSGCSHAGAVNACKHAVDLAERFVSDSTNAIGEVGGRGSAKGEQGKEEDNERTQKIPLFALVGGYHLTGPNEAVIEETVRDFKELEVKVFLAGHCTGWRAKFAIEREIPGRLAPCTVGMKYVI